MCISALADQHPSSVRPVPEWNGSSKDSFGEQVTDRSWPGPGAQRARFPAPNLQYCTEARKSAEALRADLHGRFLGGARKERPQFPRRRAGFCGRGDSNLGLLRQIKSGAAARRSPLTERPGHPESRRGCHRGISRVARWDSGGVRAD